MAEGSPQDQAVHEAVAAMAPILDAVLQGHGAHAARRVVDKLDALRKRWLYERQISPA